MRRALTDEQEPGWEQVQELGAGARIAERVAIGSGVLGDNGTGAEAGPGAGTRAGAETGATAGTGAGAQARRNQPQEQEQETEEGDR